MKKESQKDRLRALLLDMQPHRTDEILRVVYGDDFLGLANVKGRVSELRQEGYEIINIPDKKRPSLSWYKIVRIKKEPVQQEMFQPIKKINFWNE